MRDPAARRSTITLAAILAMILATTCSVLLAGGPASGATRTLKIGYILSRSSQLGGGAVAFADEVTKRIDGRCRIEEYLDAMLGGELAIVRDLKLGTVDLAFVIGGPLPKILSAVGVFNISFLFHHAAQARAVLDGPIGETYLRAFDGAGLVALAWGENGVRHLTTSRRPVRSPDDVGAWRCGCRNPTSWRQASKVWRAKVMQIPFPDLYGALQSGRVDAEENPIATIEAANFAQVQHCLTLTAHVYDPAVILMSRDSYGALSDADKRAFREAARVAGSTSRTLADEAERTGIADLKAKSVIVIETIDRAAIAAKVEDVAPSFDRLFRHDVISSIRTFRPKFAIGVVPVGIDHSPTP